MWSHNNNFPAKGFSTPPPTWKSKASFSSATPVSEKTRSMANKDDLFHVVHKVPAGDSPYVRAKQVQLIDKDPNRAISLFWAAINSGDRVDSALKDMAVVMKQLNRSDEAIEAIKSFRHLCPQESQESLDNVLVELYKRSGRLDEQIEMLQYKLKNIDEGSAFGGKRTKIARSQGKKIQISIEQEKSRLLGNLAWAYLQQGNYKTAGELYKQALALDPDRNKECNLAICLMYMNKIKEAKAMLYAIQVSSQNGRMDDSYVKSFERASQVLTELEANSVIDPNEQEGHEEMRRHLRSLVSRNSIEVNSCINEENDHLSGLVASRRRAGRQQEETMLLDKPNRRSYCQNQFENKDNFSQPDEESSKCMSLGLSSAQSPQNLYADKWKKGAQLENPFERSDFSSRRKGNWVSATDKVGSVQRRTYGSPLPVRGNSKLPSTEQRRGPCLLSKADQRKSTWGENTADSPGRKLSFEDPIAKEAGAMAPQNPDGRLQASSNEKLKIALQTSEKSLPSPGGFDGKCFRENSGKLMSLQQVEGNPQLPNQDSSTSKNKMSWADMLDYCYQKPSFSFQTPNKWYDGWSHGEDFNDENLNSNIFHQTPPSVHEIDNVSYKLEAFDLKDGYNTPGSDVSSRNNPTARRSLSNETMSTSGSTIRPKRRNRLQVFRDITLHTESPRT
ncbi:unnamed protein product, partial [Vitis vinifera]